MTLTPRPRKPLYYLFYFRMTINDLISSGTECLPSERGLSPEIPVQTASERVLEEYDITSKYSEDQVCRALCVTRRNVGVKITFLEDKILCYKRREMTFVPDTFECFAILEYNKIWKINLPKVILESSPFDNLY